MICGTLWTLVWPSLVLFNVYALLKMKGDVVHVLKDYLEKLKEGKIPSWEAEGSQPR